MAGLEKYDLKRLLGRGACGEVYLVHCKETQKCYALKKIKLDESRKTRTKAAVQREARILSELKHPHIVAFYESFFDDDNVHLCIIQNYCDGGTLDDKIKEASLKKAYFTEKEVINWFLQVAMATRYIHSKKVLHRDLKAQNIFLSKNGTVCKLGDFGIARSMNQTIDVASTCVGTPCYLSPEMCQDIPYTSKADVWALGCMLYEMLALRPAFDANNLVSLFYKIVKSEFDPLPEQYSEGMKNLVSAILVKSAEERPSAKMVLSLPFVKKALLEFIDDNELLLTRKRPFTRDGCRPFTTPNLGRTLPTVEERPIQTAQLRTIQMKRANSCRPNMTFSKEDKVTTVGDVTGRVSTIPEETEEQLTEKSTAAEKQSNQNKPDKDHSPDPSEKQHDHVTHDARQESTHKRHKHRKHHLDDTSKDEQDISQSPQREHCDKPLILPSVHSPSPERTGQLPVIAVRRTEVRPFIINQQKSVVKTQTKAGIQPVTVGSPRTMEVEKDINGNQSDKSRIFEEVADVDSETNDTNETNEENTSSAKHGKELPKIKEQAKFPKININKIRDNDSEPPKKTKIQEPQRTPRGNDTSSLSMHSTKQKSKPANKTHTTSKSKTTPAPNKRNNVKSKKSDHVRRNKSSCNNNSNVKKPEVKSPLLTVPQKVVEYYSDDFDDSSGSEDFTEIPEEILDYRLSASNRNSSANQTFEIPEIEEDLPDGQEAGDYDNYTMSDFEDDEEIEEALECRELDEIVHVAKETCGELDAGIAEDETIVDENDKRPNTSRLIRKHCIDALGTEKYEKVKKYCENNDVHEMRKLEKMVGQEHVKTIHLMSEISRKKKLC